MNVKSNSVFVIRVQGMALVNCTGAELALQKNKGLFGFCDNLNNQGLDSADNTYLDLDYSRYQTNLIQ